MIFVTLAILVSLCYSNVYTLYESGSPVVQLDNSNFDKNVIQDDALWMIEFYAPWCGHCKALKSEYTKVAEKLKGLIKIGAVDADKDKILSSRYNVKGYPSLKIFGSNKKNPIDYNGARTADAIIEGLIKHIQKSVGGGSKKSSGKEKDGDLYFLTSDNFDTFIQNSTKPVLVMFFAPWCGHCTSMHPDFKAAATQVKDSVIFVKVDATVENMLASRYQIKGFPTLKLFTANPDGKVPSFKEYNGGRSTSEIVEWLSTHVGYKPPVIETIQVTTQTDFDKNCLSKIFCMFAILPPIEDSSDQERLDYIDILNDAGTSSSGKNWGWIWSSGTNVDNIENALHIDGLSYPILVGIHNEKKVYSTLKTSFTKKNIQNFVTEIKHGRAHLSSFKTMPKMEDAKIWVAPKEKQEL